MIPTLAYELMNIKKKHINDWKECIKKNKKNLEVCRPIYEKYLKSRQYSKIPYDPSQMGYPPKNL